MNKRQIKVRPARLSDAERLLEIYAPYVEKTAITFEYEVPSVTEFRGRIEQTLKKYPWLVAEADGEPVGYAYTGMFHARAAYDWSVETSIYLDENRRGLGAGRILYEALEKVSRAQHILNFNACISYPEPEDEYLTRNSVEFHTHLGYRMVGRFHKCGYKFGRWYDMVWMEKMLGEHPEHPEPVLPFQELKENFPELTDLL